MFTMWLGQLIDSDGLGGGGWASGVNMIVLANILAAGPLDLVRLLPAGTLRFALLLLALGLLVVPVLLVQGAQRRVPVQYAHRVRGTRLYGGAHTYMPFPLVYGGLDAIETVYSFAAFGALIVGALAARIPALGALLESWAAQPAAGAAALTLAPGELAGALAMFLSVALLTMFQADVGFTEGEYAENLRRAGGFVPDIRPGKPTDTYLRGIVTRISFFGALSLALYSILPWLLRWVLGLPQPVYVAWAVWTLCRIIVDYFRVIEARLAMLGYRDNILVR
jgi:preprotein translocase subunit SecY